MKLEFHEIQQEEKTLFQSVGSCLHLDGETVSADSISRIVRVSAGSRYYYVKRYQARGRGLRRYLGRSRLRAEWDSLHWFRANGIPTAQPVAFGEGRNKGGYRGVIVVREREGTSDLMRLSVNNPALFSNRRWRHRVIRRLGKMVHRMHARGFVHRDLKWRNILVEATPDPGVYIIDCPQGRRLVGPFLARGRIKDLASLDRMGRARLSRTDRLRFFLASQGRCRLIREDRMLISRILSYYEGRSNQQHSINQPSIRQ